MGREKPTSILPSNLNRRAERARRAKETINKAIPDILRSSPRVRHGIHKSDLVVDPETASQHGTSPIPSSDSGPKIRLVYTDTLDAAARISDRPFATRRNVPTLKTNKQKPNVAILSFASPLKPGGGFLEGANSQEEFICARTTLYPSLWDSFYRLPEVGGIYTPDAMVFRDSTPEANELMKRDRFFVDVLSAAMIRFPEVRGRADERSEHGGCSCGVSYCDRDRELVTRKMKAVMRIAQSKGVEKLVLGAWGCGAYGNPVKEVAKIWRKVIAGSQRQRRPNAERWQGIKEVVFAIPDRTMAREFELAFKDVLTTDAPSPREDEDVEAGALPADEDAEMAELVSKIQETEMQIELVQSTRSKHRLREVLAGLNRDLAQGLAAKRTYKDEDLTHSSDEDGEEDFVTVNSYVPASDCEENSFYNFDEGDIASDSSDCTVPEAYEFRPQPPGLDFETSHDEDDELENETQSYTLLQPSPRFDAKTGWFNGSIDQLHGILRGTGQRQGSHASPVLRPEEASGQVVDELVLNDYMEKFEGHAPAQ